MANKKILKLVIQNRNGSTITDFDWPADRDIPQYLQILSEGATIFTCASWNTAPAYVVFSPAEQSEIEEFVPAEGSGYHYQKLPGFYVIVNRG